MLEYDRIDVSKGTDLRKIGGYVGVFFTTTGVFFKEILNFSQMDIMVAMI